MVTELCRVTPESIACVIEPVLGRCGGRSGGTGAAAVLFVEAARRGASSWGTAALWF